MAVCREAQIIAIFSTVFLQATFAYPNHEVCTLHKIASCTSTLKNFIAEKNLQEVVKVADEQELETLCSDYEKTKLCIEPFEDNCDDVARAGFDGLFDGYKWLCGEGRTEFLRHNPCVVAHEDTIKRKTEACTATFKGQVDVEDKDQTCRKSKELITCAGRAVSDSCGKEAGDWLTEYNTRSLSPLFKKLGCNEYSLSDILHIVAVVCAIISVITFGVGFAYRKCKKSTPQYAPQPFSVLTSPTSQGYKNFAN